MRRAVSTITVAVGLFPATVWPAGAATAAPAAPAPAAAEAAPTGEKRCSITDERLDELSGLIATKTGYIVINDGTDDASRKKIFYLNGKCEITRTVSYSGQGPADPEDLALSPNGSTLWIADIGDNVTSAKRRERVAVWTMPVTGGKQPVLHRLAYPERKPHDAEALLVGADNLPLIITKTLSGKAEIFAPAAALKTNNVEPVPMKKVGEVSLPKTDTPNLLQGPGRVAITGAARSPDGGKVVLRTYADAFEYDVTGGDVLAALTTGTPRVTPLADPFGEAISYTADGASFVTVSDAGELGDDVEIDILAYQPSTRGAQPLAEEPRKKAAEASWMDGLSLDDITYLIAAVGALGALLVGVGIVGIVRARRRPQPAKGGPRGTGDLPAAEALDRGPRATRHDPPAGREPQRGGVYGAPPAGGGGARQPGRGGGGNVYGGPPAAGGAVYGGGPAGGGGASGGRGGSSGGRGGYEGGSSGGRGGRAGYGGPSGGGGSRAGYGGRGGGSGVYGAGGGGVYGGGRAEPPRRGGGSGRRDDAEYGRRGGHDPEGYGRSPGRDHRGSRY